MKLDLPRAKYIGLQKVSAMTASSDTVETTRSFSAGFSDLTPEGGWRQESAMKPELAVDPAYLRDRAVTLISSAFADAPVILPGTPVEIGQWYQIAGQSRFIQTFHDDFRDRADTAPRVAAWLLEVPNADRDSVTWLVIHGSADGNMYDTFDATLPAKRAGSGTEALFEFLYARANGAELRGEELPRQFRPEMLAWAVSEMFNDYSNHRSESIEAVFRVSDILDPSALVTTKLPLVSIHGLSSRSRDGRESPVTQVIIGSPLAVQAPAPKPRSRVRRMLTRKRTGDVPRFDKDDVTDPSGMYGEIAD
ncbi:hypothetical protein [Microbacterium sp. NPDC087591]|uniref:hypothetical protein n=1 Tax=Microbacterium sp. NPDC087591 TaxID=3364192 RepID=UPI003825ED53